MKIITVRSYLENRDPQESSTASSLSICSHFASSVCVVFTHHVRHTSVRSAHSPRAPYVRACHGSLIATISRRVSSRDPRGAHKRVLLLLHGVRLLLDLDRLDEPQNWMAPRALRREPDSRYDEESRGSRATWVFRREMQQLLKGCERQRGKRPRKGAQAAGRASAEGLGGRAAAPSARRSRPGGTIAPRGQDRGARNGGGKYEERRDQKAAAPHSA